MEEQEPTSEEQFTELISSANANLAWARDKANEFLEYANELEERASRYRALAATMVIEARSYADETADLLLAEFPFNDATIPGDEQEENVSL